MFSYHFLLPFLLFLLSSSLLQISAAEDNGHALDLSSTFKSVVLPSLDKANWLVEFYSPMCGSCKEFSPIWNKMTTMLRTTSLTLKFGTVNIDTKEGMELAQALGVLEEGLPNVRFFKSSTSAINSADTKLTSGVSILGENPDTSSLNAKALVEKVKRMVVQAPTHTTNAEELRA